MGSAKETPDKSSLTPTILHARTEANNLLSNQTARTVGSFGEVSADQYGGLYVTTFASIYTNEVAMTHAAAAYATGKCIGGFRTISNVNRGNNMGCVIETCTVRIAENKAAASLPDLDVFICKRPDFIQATSITDNNYPDVKALDGLMIAGVFSIRVAAGHWRQIFSAAGTVSWSLAVINPYLSFYTNNASSATSDIGFFIVNAGASFTFAATGELSIDLTVRKG